VERHAIAAAFCDLAAAGGCVSSTHASDDLAATYWGIGEA